MTKPVVFVRDYPQRSASLTRLVMPVKMNRRGEIMAVTLPEVGGMVNGTRRAARYEKRQTVEALDNRRQLPSGRRLTRLQHQHVYASVRPAS